MKKAVFKTNINCGSCVANVTPFLEKAQSIDDWQVDTANKDKILTVKGTHVDVAEVTRLVTEAGYNIAEKKSGLKKLFG
ncbi:MAG: hypothetical protein Roseis2KO_00390 [Roseivirga sp.]